MTTKAKDRIWVEKYRPETLDDIIGNEAEVDRLKAWSDDPSCPNVLLYGPHGTGKTAASRSFAKDKYGDEWQNHVLEMNASDERGIDDVRNKIKGFAQQGGVMGEHDFNLIILDEVDNMTRDAQPAMRRVMEDYDDRVRFMLMCNWPSQLIDPLQSRCTPLNISPLEDDQMVQLLKKVAENEAVSYSEEQLSTIVSAVDGDARAGIHTLQSATTDGELEDVALDAVVRVVDTEEVGDVVEEALEGDLEAAMEGIDDLLQSGADPQTIAREMLDHLKGYRGEIPDDSWALLISDLAEVEFRVQRGGSPDIQFHNMISDMAVSRHVSAEPYRRDNQDASM